MLALGLQRPAAPANGCLQVLYFNKPPTPQEVLGSLLKGLGGQGQAAASPAAAGAGGGPPPGVQTLIAGTAGGGSMASGNGGGGDVILVTGATGGVGKRVVARLLAAGRHVRALVRDVPKARELLSGLPAGAGGSLELAGADLTQAATLQPAFFEGVQAVVCCHAVTVVPKGDTPDRAKYYQARRGGWFEVGLVVCFLLFCVEFRFFGNGGRWGRCKAGCEACALLLVCSGAVLEPS